jgi:multidrug efflux pump subunit AcrB
MIPFFAGHPTAANLLMVVFLGLGLAAAPSLNRETFPEIPPDQVQAQVPYRGAGAEDVEEAICRRIEDALDGVTDIEELRCEAREGLATAIVEMAEGGDFDRLLTEVKTEVDAIDDFPADVETPTVRQLGRTDHVVSIALTGPLEVPDLKLYAEGLKDRLQQIDGVAGIELQGFSDHQIRIVIPAQTLRQYGLSVADVARMVGRQSLDLPTGTLETADQDLRLRFDDERRRADEFRDLIVVGGESGAEIRLGDIATVTDRFELDEDKLLFNGKRAALLDVKKHRDADTLGVIDAVRAFVERERQLAPPDMTFTLTQDVSSIVRDRLTMLLRNGAQGLVLVLLTLALFFSLRYAFWVAMGLPVSFAGAIFGMSFLGYSIDMITMVGLLIAIGILVDDAIVIAENIASHHQRGEAPIRAAVDGTREVARGVLASFATTALVFGPLAFLKGDIGAVLKVMPVVLILTLSVSLVEAFWILPYHISHALHAASARPPTGFRRRFEAGLDWVRERLVGSLVDAAVGARYLTLGLAVMLFLASVAMVLGGALKFRVFPDLDGDVIEARILLPQGTPLGHTEEVVAQVAAALQRVDAELTPLEPTGARLVRNVNIQFNRNVDAFEVGPHVATVSVDLLSAERRSAKLDEVLRRWRQEVGIVPDVLSLKFTEFVIGPGGLALDIRLQGADLDQSLAAARELKGWLAGYRGVHDLSDDLRPGKPEIRVALREGALALGLDARTIAAQLRAAFFGETAAEIQVGPESYEIDVRVDPRDKDSLADLEDFTVTAADGRQVPLGAVATLTWARGFARINRVDRKRTVTLQGDVDTEIANASAIVADTRARFLPELERRYPGVAVRFEGQEKEAGTTGASIRNAFTFGLVGVFLLLSFMFRSYIEPLVVMVAIPMGLVGVVWGHLAMGLELSMPSAVGFVSLTGVVVNDSILLVEFVKRRTGEGRPVPEAARLASRQRFRAVLLTSLTTVMGLSPLLAEHSLQAQVLKPLVTSLAFGLAASTLMVLFVVPALYVILDDLGLSTVARRADAAAGLATTTGSQ